MQKEDIALETIPGKKPSAVSLYTEEETGDVSTTSSWTKVDSTVGSEVNVSEVSSTSEDTYQPLSTSSTSLFTDFNNKQVVDSGPETVSGVKNKNSVSGDAGNDKKPKPGLSLLGEYADSENDTEEETQRSLGTKQEKLYGVEEMSSDKIKFSNPECASTGAERYENQSSNKTVETGVMDASIEIPQAISDVCSPVEVKTEYGKDVDAHTHPDNSFAKLKRSVSKEEGQISADSDSSGSERSSESRKGSKTQKDAKKDKSKKKDKKKKKRKKRKRKHSSEKKELDATESEEKKDRKLRRSRSREMSEKRKPLRRSRSRSRDRDLTRRRCPRSSSQDKGKRSRHLIEQSKRSRSRSTGRRSSATNRYRDLKSRSKSPKRSSSPSRRRRDRGARYSPVSRVRRESPSLKRKRVSRSRSPRRSSEWRKSKSPRRRTRSPDKRKRTTPDRSPGARSTPRKARSPNRRETKQSHSPPRKSSHRTSSASDSLDSGHFTNIPLSKSNKPEEHVSENKESGQKPLPHSNKSSIEKQESSIVPKPADLEKQYSPSGSPAKSWEDEFDFVFTERMSPRQGTGKSVEDVLFGTEPKTPDFKRPTPSESKKSKQKESQHTEKKEETKTEKLKGVTALADEKNKLPQTSQNQNGSSNLQSKSSLNSVEQSLSTLKDSKSGSKASKSDIKDDDDDIKKTGNDANSPQITNTHDKSAFVQSKPETIPFLDENPYVPPPVGVGTQNSDPVSQLGILGPPPANTGLLPTQALHDRIWLGLGEVGLLPAPGSQQNVNSGKNDIKKAKLDNRDQSVTRKDEGRNIFDGSPVDMEMSSPEGDIIDQMNEEFWKQQQKSSLSTTESEDSKSREETANPVFHGQSSVEEPYEPESGLVIGEESEEDLTKITDPKERRKREKQQQKEKTKVQELIDKLHRQARVEEEVKHALKAYYKHRDISKEEYKSILRRAVPQVTNSSSAIDPERIRSLVKKYVAKIKGQRVDSH